jgi:hypothetical protein
MCRDETRAVVLLVLFRQNYGVRVGVCGGGGARGEVAAGRVGSRLRLRIGEQSRRRGWRRGTDSKRAVSKIIKFCQAAKLQTGTTGPESTLCKLASVRTEGTVWGGGAQPCIRGWA